MKTFTILLVLNIIACTLQVESLAVKLAVNLTQLNKISKKLAQNSPKMMAKVLPHIADLAQEGTTLATILVQHEVGLSQTNNVLGTVANLASIAASIAAFVIPQNGKKLNAESRNLLSTVANLGSIAASIAAFVLPETNPTTNVPATTPPTNAPTTTNPTTTNPPTNTNATTPPTQTTNIKHDEEDILKKVKVFLKNILNHAGKMSKGIRQAINNIMKLLANEMKKLPETPEPKTQNGPTTPSTPTMNTASPKETAPTTTNAPISPVTKVVPKSNPSETKSTTTVVATGPNGKTNTITTHNPKVAKKAVDDIGHVIKTGSDWIGD